jgi:hypothetical protein
MLTLKNGEHIEYCYNEYNEQHWRENILYRKYTEFIEHEYHNSLAKMKLQFAILNKAR